MGKQWWREEDLEITHFKGSGPGGQNRNKRFTGVRVKHLPTGVVALATERRSQGQNLSAALERLQERLERLFHKPKPRRATRKPKASVRRRLDAKGKRGETKAFRGKVRVED